MFYSSVRSLRTCFFLYVKNPFGRCHAFTDIDMFDYLGRYPVCGGKVSVADGFLSGISATLPQRFSGQTEQWTAGQTAATQ